MQYDQYAVKEAGKAKYTVSTGKIEGICQFLAASKNLPPSNTGFSQYESFCITQSQCTCVIGGAKMLSEHTYTLFYCSRRRTLTHTCS